MGLLPQWNGLNDASNQALHAGCARTKFENCYGVDAQMSVHVGSPALVTVPTYPCDLSHMELVH
jgi:hypothetical protein